MLFFNVIKNPKIVKLFKALYGLNSSPQLFNKMLNNVLTDPKGLNLTRIHSDSCLYHYADENGVLLLATEVDDLVITGNNAPKLNDLRSALQKEFGEIEQFETISSFLGINICYNRDSGILTMDVESKIKSFLRASSLSPTG